MKIELTADDRLQMSPAEIEALTGEGAAEALGAHEAEQPEAKAATDETEVTAAEGVDTLEKTGTSEEGEATPTELSAEALETVAADELPEHAVQYKTGDVEALKAERQAALDERKTLRAERKDIEAKYTAGDLTDEERAAKLDEVDDKLDALSDKSAELVGAIARAETLTEANRQHLIDTQTRAIDALKVRSRKDGFDYDKDEKAPAQFNRALGMIAGDPDNAKRDFAEMVDEAHKMVMAMRGLTAEPKPKPAEKVEKPEPKPRDVPRTLSGMPTAGASPIGDDLSQQLSTLEGEDAELFLAKLPAGQIEKLLRSAH